MDSDIAKSLPDLALIVRRDGVILSCVGGNAVRGLNAGGYQLVPPWFPGKMSTPHGVWLDNRPGRDVTLVVADRANARLQYFTLDGKHVLMRSAGEGFVVHVESGQMVDAGAVLVELDY